MKKNKYLFALQFLKITLEFGQSYSLQFRLAEPSKIEDIIAVMYSMFAVAFPGSESFHCKFNVTPESR